jgi:hypothetical protein
MPQPASSGPFSLDQKQQQQQQQQQVSVVVTVQLQQFRSSH